MLKKNKGFGLVEIIVASALMVVVVLAVMNAFSAYVKTSKNNTDSIKASYLAEEGIEAVKIMRDGGWNKNISPISMETAFRITWSGTTWATTSESTLVGGKYDRTIVFHSAYRDIANKDLASSGDIDTDARKVTVNISWNNNGSTTTKTIETYITNLFESI